RKKNGLVVVSYSKELMDVCVRSCGKGAATKRLSRDIMLLPPEKQKVLLEAYFKGDGSVYKKGRLMVRASTVSEVLAYQLQELLARQGIFASIYEREGSEDVIDGRRIRRRKQYVIYYSPRKRWRVVRMVD
ncbi:MAG: LAGLIDADG family homing endonuclease, partial [Nitrososphaerota archaeon]